ncbi:hypothetical protein PG989_016337 [Apiospora arundinis]
MAWICGHTQTVLNGLLIRKHVFVYHDTAMTDGFKGITKTPRIGLINGLLKFLWFGKNRNHRG